MECRKCDRCGAIFRLKMALRSGYVDLNTDSMWYHRDLCTKCMKRMTEAIKEAMK